MSNSLHIYFYSSKCLLRIERNLNHLQKRHETKYNKLDCLNSNTHTKKVPRIRLVRMLTAINYLSFSNSTQNLCKIMSVLVFSLWRIIQTVKKGRREMRYQQIPQLLQKYSIIIIIIEYPVNILCHFNHVHT